MGKRHTSSRGRGRAHGRPLRIGDIAVALIVICIGSYCVFPSFRFMLGHLWNDVGFLVPHSVSVDDLPPSEAARQLKALTVLDHDDAPNYDRDQFGQAWADEDHNGCDTRNDVLARDLTNVTYKPKTRDCVVLTGTLNDPYTGSTINFQRGQDTSALVQIDHVVALGNAWRSGAWQWDDTQRQRFGNDQNNLLAVDGQTNKDKGAASADKWLPPNADFRCAYVTKQINVKYTWGLTITSAEQSKMASVLAGCKAS